MKQIVIDIPDDFSGDLDTLVTKIRSRLHADEWISHPSRLIKSSTEYQMAESVRLEEK